MTSAQFLYIKYFWVIFRTATSYLCAQSIALPLLKKLDRLIELVMTREQTEACAKGFSDPSFFLTKWQR